MAVRQLTPGSSLDVPVGALRVRLDAPPGVRIEVRGPDNRPMEPAHRSSSTEAILLPMGAPTLVGAIPATPGQPFPPGSLVGVTVSAASGVGDEYVRPCADVGGRAFAGLVRVTPGNPPTLSDALEIRRRSDVKPFNPRQWHRLGAYAYHAHHEDGNSSRGSWTLVVDASASMLLPERQSAIGELLEALVGITGTARGSAPTAALLCTYPEPTDFAPALEADSVDWARVLGVQPSPWSRVTPCLERAASALDYQGLVVLLTDGPPVDLADVEAWQAASGCELLFIALGRSPREVLPASRPTQTWDNDLGALDPLGSRNGVAVVTICNPAGAIGSAVLLADAMIPTTAWQ